MEEGTRLGRYAIRRRIGSGGMGEVFAAHDSQLDREVALKVLLPEFCCDLERVRRFKAEARAASALNHPNIITIFEVAEDRDQLFIATEYVSGRTLRELIDEGDLTLGESLRIAEQAAEALAVAHDAQIVHRDIKPENIMVRRDGIVKLLDFGLAKPLIQQRVGAEDETVQLVQTQPGIVMGSVRYMSPEQARGKETDGRTDVWSLGVVIYEMLAGRNPFDGETVSDSLAAVIHLEPPPLDEIPDELQRILRKALRKRADDRYQNIRDLALDLREVRTASEVSGERRAADIANTVSFRRYDTEANATLIHRTLSSETKTTGGGRSPDRRQTTGTPRGAFRFMPVWLMLLAVAIGAGAWYAVPNMFRRGAPAFDSIQASRLTDNLNSGLAEISPDGRFVVFIDRQGGRQALVVRQIATASTVTLVPPTLNDYHQPTFTPDGEFVFYTQIDKGVGTLFRVPALGGEPVAITRDVDSKVTFSPDGRRLAFIRHDPNEGGDTIFIENSDGSGIEPFIQTKDVSWDRFAGVDWSPDGRLLMLSVFRSGGESDQKAAFATVTVADKKFEKFGDRGWLGVKSFEWTRDGSGIVLVGKSNTGDNIQVWHLAYPTGALRQITTDTSDYGSVSISADGSTLVATRVDTISGLWSLNPKTKESKQIVADNKNLIGVAGIAQSSVGKLVFVKVAGKDLHLFSVDENGGNEKQLTTGKGQNLFPAVTGDGKRIVFSSNREGNALSVWRMESDGSGAVRLTTPENANDAHNQITADGRFVIFMRQSADGGRAKMMKVPIEGGDPVALLPDHEASEVAPRLSADGKRLGYHTFDYDSRTGSFSSSVRIVGFDGGSIDPKIAEKELRINPDFGFSPDGRSVTYLNRAGIPNLWSVALDDLKERPLTDFNSGLITNFAWSRDGARLFVIRASLNTDLVLIRDASGA